MLVAKDGDPYLGIHISVFSTWTLAEEPRVQCRAFKESELASWFPMLLL